MKNIRVKRKLSGAVFSLVLIAGLFSCDTDKLNTVPKNQISDVVAFDSPERIALAVNGLYATMKNGNFLGGRVYVYGDIRADDFINRNNNGVTGLLVWNHTINSASNNDVINLWTFIYQGINQVNVFLDGMEANKDKFVPPAFPAGFSATANAAIAEARFLRGLAYHYLLQFYAGPYADGNGARRGLPLRLIGEKNSTGNDLARASVGQVYTQIISDLDFAEANLPLTYADGLTRTTRAHRNTAIAVKTRVYLTMGDWVKVISEGNKIVPQAAGPFSATTGVAHALQANVNNVFTGSQETTESILSMPFTAQNAPGVQNPLAFYWRASVGLAPAAVVAAGGGEYHLNPAGIVADVTNWPATDARRTSFVYSAGPVGATDRYIGNKFPGGTPYLDKAPVIRYAEVLLNVAEAETRGGNAARGLLLLNAVRTRSTTATGARVFTTQAQQIADILVERRIEFLGEGLRNQDIMRLGQPFPVKAAVAAVAPSSPVWVWPIPDTEISANTLCEINEPGK